MDEEKTQKGIEPAVQRPRESVASRVAADRSRLTVMPLAVLLPSVGDLSDLTRLAPMLQKRLGELQHEKVVYAVEESDEQTGRVSEESMLNQVLLWLSAGDDEK